jgi:hypothetical protein
MTRQLFGPDCAGAVISLPWADFAQFALVGSCGRGS